MGETEADIGKDSPEVGTVVPAAPAASPTFLIGVRGSDFVRDILSGERPVPAIDKIHKRCGLPEDCEPFVQLLEHLSVNNQAGLLSVHVVCICLLFI